MAATSKEEKPTAPLMPAVQPATLLPAVQPAVPPAVQPAVPFAAVQQVNKLDVAQRHESRRWQSWRRVVAVHTVHSAALVLYYLNTDQRAWYCVLYVFLFIIYNTVFCIVQP